MNNHEVQISLTITPTWTILKEVQKKIEDFMNKKRFSTELIEASIMCASELVENAIKYGSAGTDQDNIKFDLKTENGRIVIKVSNGVKDERDFLNVKERVDKLKKSKNPAELYMERLKELMESPKPGESQLGLDRVGYEGG